MVPTNAITQNSFLTAPVDYIKRAIKISAFRGDVKSKLFNEQKNICKICNNKLVDLYNFVTISTIENNIFINNEILPETNADLLVTDLTEKENLTEVIDKEIKVYPTGARRAPRGETMEPGGPEGPPGRG